MARLLPFSRVSASVIFDLEDGYARRRGVRGLHPRPIGPLAYHVRGRMRDGVLEPYEPGRLLRIRRNPSGYDLCFGEAEVPDGTVRTLAAGVYAVRITSRARYYEPVERRDIALPRPGTPYAIDLEPAVSYPFPLETLPGRRGPTLLRGTYRALDGQGIADTTVQVLGVSSISRTGPDGQWVLAFPDDVPSGNVTVRFVRPDGRFEQAANVPVTAGRTISVGDTVLRGWTISTAGAPLRGADVTVAAHPPVRSAADGSWSAHLGVTQQDADVSITASLPDGRSATQPSVHVTARATTHVPTFRL